MDTKKVQSDILREASLALSLIGIFEYKVIMIDGVLDYKKRPVASVTIDTGRVAPFSGPDYEKLSTCCNNIPDVFVEFSAHVANQLEYSFLIA